MSVVTPLRNAFSEVRRMQELQEIGLLYVQAEQLYGSLRLWTFPQKRFEILTKVELLLTEAHSRRGQYFASIGQEIPPMVLPNINLG